MPWKETSAMDQRIQLIADWLSGDHRKSELCQIYGISRPTADKWIGRYDEHGLQGLSESNYGQEFTTEPQRTRRRTQNQATTDSLFRLTSISDWNRSKAPNAGT